MAAKIPEDFKSLSEELDSLLVRLQGNDIQVDEAVKLFQKGNEIVGKLEIYLKKAENTLTVLKTRSEETISE